MTPKINFIHTRTGCYGLQLAEQGLIKATALAVLIALASFVDGSTMTTSIDQASLAKRAGVSLETLRRQLRILEKVGILTTIRRFARSNIYKINPLKSGENSATGNPQNNGNITLKRSDYSITNIISKNRNDDLPDIRATTY